MEGSRPLGLKAIMDEVDAVFKKHGVCNYFYCLTDPDSDLYGAHRHGNLTWAIGAAELAKKRMVREVLAEEETQQSDED